MRHALLLLPLLLAGGCAPSHRPYSAVDNVHYAALGQEPFWLLSIGDDRIVLTFGPEPGARPRDLNSHSWPRTLPRTVDGVRRWESGSGTEVISVEAAPGPCEGSRGSRYRDQVRVRLSGRELVGCGGPLLGSERG